MKRAKKPAEPLTKDQAKVAAQTALELLRAAATEKTRLGMGRFGLPNDKALGVAVGDIQKIGKLMGRSHELAIELWKHDTYEARMLVSFVGEPERLTVAQMDAWCRDFDNWGIVDTLCFKLFDETPLAWECVPLWAEREDEFQKRAAYALIACLAGHDEDSGDQLFLDCLPLIEKAATDERNFVKKGVSWALRGMGGRSDALAKRVLKLATKLAASSHPAERWIGKDVVRWSKRWE